MSDTDDTPQERDLVEAMAAIWHDVMSPGDRSTAFANAKISADGDEARMMTSRVSPNDRFWGLMVQLGWAEAVPEAVKDLPGDDLFVAFRLTEAGKGMLPQFLDAVV